jgi:sigma-E factor negative regulatory protein RseC
MTQTAVVKNVYENGLAEVLVSRTSACGHECSGGSGACSGCLFEVKPLSVKARNTVGACVGERVVIETGTGSVLSAAILVYLLPLAFLVAALILASVAGAQEASVVLSGVLSFALGCAASVIINKGIRKDRPLEYIIIGRVS